MSSERQPGGVALAFRNRAYRIYTLGAAPSQIGTWMQRVGVQWLAWELTGSAAWLGIIGFADLFPVVVLAPLAGALADRLDRLRVARILQFLNMGQSLILVALTLNGLITIEILFALTLFQGALNSMFQPFRQAIIANLVTREELPPAIAVNSVTWHGSRFVGPAIAGPIIVVGGVVPVFIVNAVTYIGFLIALYMISLPAHTPARRSLMEIPAEIVDSLRYVAAHPAIKPALLSLLAASFLGRPVMELLAGFASAVFDRGAVGLAWLTSASGLGAMVVALWFAQRVKVSDLPRMLPLAVLLVALSQIAFAITDIFWFAVAAIAVAGGVLVMGGITTQTIVQTVVAETMRGRVLGVYGLIWLGSPALGALIMGVAGDLVGLRWPVFGAGVLCLVAWRWALSRRPAIAAALREVGG